MTLSRMKCSASVLSEYSRNLFRAMYSIALLVLAVNFVGCRSTEQAWHSEYEEVSCNFLPTYSNPGVEVEVDNSAFATLEGRHSVEEYVLIALSQNPNILAAQHSADAYEHLVAVAGSLQDPTLKATVLPEPVQTAAGQQEFILAASQKIPWAGKLDTKACIAQEQANVSHSQLQSVELATVAKVKRAYYELYFTERAIAVTHDDQELLKGIRDVALVRYKSGKVSQQDVLRAELEISNIEREFIRLHQEQTSAQARLARVLHIPLQTKLQTLEKLNPEEAPINLATLQQKAVAARPELHAQLAAVKRDQLTVDLAHLDYRPDVTLGATWIDVSNAGISPVTNGRDAFLLSAGINLPIYRTRLASAVQAAEAKAIATARTYDSLRDATLEEVADLFAKAQSQQEMLTLFQEDILPRARQTLEVSTRAYASEEIDFLQLVDNWRQLLRYQINEHRLEASLRQTLADIERIVGGRVKTFFSN